MTANALRARLPALERLELLCVGMTRPIAFAGVIAMLAVAAVTMVDVLVRLIASQSIAAVNEIVSMVFAVAVSACIPAGLALRVNLKVDLLEGSLGRRWEAWLAAIGDAVLGLFFLILAWQVALYAGELSGQNRTTIMLRWPQAPFMYAAAALMAAGVVVQAVMTLNAFRRALAVRIAPDEADTGSPAAKAFVLLVGAVTLALIAVGVMNFQVISRVILTSPGTAVTLSCLLLWAILLAQIPLAAVMGLIGIVGTAAIIGFGPGLNVFATEVTGFLTNSLVAVLPLFLLMGSFAAVAGLADDAYGLANALLQRFRGGLAMATIGGCAGFGAMTGSSVATAATIGRVALPEMAARKYSPALATGSVAAGGTLGNLVPPGSGPLVLFALLTEASIGQLFVASVIPALIIILAYIVTVAIYVRMVPLSAPPPTAPKPGELSSALRRCGPLFSLFFIVLGGIYFGVFTTTEAAAVGAFLAFVVAVLRGKLKERGFIAVMGETTVVTAMVYSLIFGALIFAFFCEASQLSKIMTTSLSELGLRPILVIAVLVLMFILLGTFMDSYAIMIATIPIVTPLVLDSGYDLIWWGIINLFVIEIGGISPPFGLNMFVLKSLQDVPMSTIFKGVLPFCFSAIMVLILLVLVPQLTLWLPSTMGN